MEWIIDAQVRRPKEPRRKHHSRNCRVLHCYDCDWCLTSEAYFLAHAPTYIYCVKCIKAIRRPGDVVVRMQHE